ncbi:hypothetical protein B0T16DRAFT_332152 [Cercophora newfieldiana]|uniref:Ankyrin repeat protein n=1 Tax=Cercophora newfieldiana TaxID=92897 RepID=A0AA39XZT1_9PEZI|nr:hypothetical protein B0T16DRAFT_332152 [Cercophora newfieldiana]
MSRNPYLLAADDPEGLLALLQEDPSLASGQDEHGYSLIHAAASYNHLDLLRKLVRDFKVPIDLRDEDGETALFVIETVDVARVLVEELALDPSLKNDEGLTASEKIEAEDEFPAVAEYLKTLNSSSTTTNGTTNGEASESLVLPPAPEGLQVRVGMMDEAEVEELQADPEIRRRIEELAAREDFQSPEGQAELRRLVMEVIVGQELSEERSVRSRQE